MASGGAAHGHSTAGEAHRGEELRAANATGTTGTETAASAVRVDETMGSHIDLFVVAISRDAFCIAKNMVS